MLDAFAFPTATSDGVDDLLLHASVGMTMAHLAAQSDRASRNRARYLANAEAALTEVQRDARHVTLPPEDAVALTATLNELAALVAALHGEPRSQAVQSHLRRPAPPPRPVHRAARLGPPCPVPHLLDRDMAHGVPVPPNR